MHPAWSESSWCSSVFSMLPGSHGALCPVGQLQTLELLGPTSRHLSVPQFLAMLDSSVTLALAFAGQYFLTEARGVAVPQELYWSPLTCQS